MSVNPYDLLNEAFAEANKIAATRPQKIPDKIKQTVDKALHQIDEARERTLNQIKIAQDEAILEIKNAAPEKTETFRIRKLFTDHLDHLGNNLAGYLTQINQQSTTPDQVSSILENTKKNLLDSLFEIEKQIEGNCEKNLLAQAMIKNTTFTLKTTLELCETATRQNTQDTLTKIKDLVATAHARNALESTDESAATLDRVETIVKRAELHTIDAATKAKNNITQAGTTNATDEIDKVYIKAKSQIQQANNKEAAVTQARTEIISAAWRNYVGYIDQISREGVLVIEGQAQIEIGEISVILTNKKARAFSVEMAQALNLFKLYENDEIRTRTACTHVYKNPINKTIKSNFSSQKDSEYWSD